MQHTIAVDLAKSVFQVAVSHHPGRVSQNHRFSRSQFQRFMAQQQPARVLLEACGSAHHWGRHLQQLGHAVTLLPPHHVRRYRDGNKTDKADTKAILEAFRNEDIQPIPIKSHDQQSLAALHRLRSAYKNTRTARINTIRGLLREFGITIPVGAKNVIPHVHALESDSVPGPLLIALRETATEIDYLDTRIHQVEVQIDFLARQIPTVGHLRSIPGIGLLTATALVAFVGDVRRFPSARRFAGYLGLVPKEHSSGSKRRLGAISKRGDTYLRMLLIHGARSVLWAAKSKTNPAPLYLWALDIQQRRGHNIAAVALANKLARFAWIIWKDDRPFRLPA